MMRVEVGKPEAIETLLDLGADSTVKDKSGRTPLVVAWQYGQTDRHNEYL